MFLKRKPKKNTEKLPEESKPQKDFIPILKKNKFKKPIIIAVVVIVAASAVFSMRHFSLLKGGSNSNITYTTATVTRRNITKTLTGNGTLEPANSYDVTALVSGKVLSAPFEEGDTVKKDAVLYKIDSSDAENNIKSAALSLEKSRVGYNQLLKNLDDLSTKSPASGIVLSLDVDVGDSVQSGQKIGIIRNSSVMSLKVPFNSDDANKFYIGEKAAVTLDSTFETLQGTVSKINSIQDVLSGNKLVKYVTIDVSNPGGITDATAATAKVENAACSSSATFAYKSEESITASSSGKVSSILVSEGDCVTKSQVILRLGGSDLEEQIKTSALSLQDAELALESKEKALEDYTIKSPIAGKIIVKNYKQGDTLGSGSSSSSSSGSSSSSKGALCTIYDLSYLTMDLNVDELDVSEVQVGQKVTITADAVEGKTYEGVVTKVNINGTTSNGVTTYPVTIRINQADGLLPGMNVDAKIVVESTENVLAIPVDAVSRGNRVLVKTSSEQSSATNAVQSPSGTSQSTVARTGRTPASWGKNAASASPSTSARRNGNSETLSSANSIPEGFKYVQVTLGINDDTYIEVKNGLKEGDVIAIVAAKSEPKPQTDKSTEFDMGDEGQTSGSRHPGSGGPPADAGGGGMGG